MPKNFRQIRRILLKNGFIEMPKRGKGGHIMFFNPVTKRKLTLPSYSKDIGVGLEKEIWKQAGLDNQNL